MDGGADPRALGQTPRTTATAPRSLDVLPVRLGPYLVERRLGAGGMGVVFEALEVDRDRRVALKLLPAHEPDSLARFKAEFRIVADVAHPNLVTLYELQAVDGYWFIAMERLDGSVLRRHLIETGLVPGSEAFSTHVRHALAQVATGLAALHHAGVLHLDVKPANIMVTPSGRAVLLDFGLVERAAARDPRLRRGRVAGTPEYMSPEQARGEDPTSASDWYSLGVTLFEVLTGRLPIVGADGAATMRRKLTTEPPRAGTLARGIPPELEELCARLLSREPADRPSWAEIRAALMPDGSSSRFDLGVRESRLFGREQELELLSEGLSLVARGAPVSVYLHGPSGIGKSALLRGFREHIIDGAQPRSVVLLGRCYERETVPYKGLDTVIDALCDHLRGLPASERELLLPEDLGAAAKLFPVLARLSLRIRVPQDEPPAEVQERAHTALKTLFWRVAQQLRLVVMIDDLQWGDQDSARLWVDLLSPPRAPPLLFVGAFRTEEAEGPFLSELRRLWDQPQGGALRKVIALSALSRDESKAFAAMLLGADEQSRASVIADAAEGSPFLVEQLSLSAQDGSGPVEDLLGRRLVDLEPEPKNALRFIALAGRPLEQRVLERAVGVDAFQPLFALRSARLVRTRGARDRDFVECYHDRIREAVTRDLPLELVKSTHERLAECLEAIDDTQADHLAFHWREAGRVDRAAPYALIAAEDAWAHLAFDRAADLFELAKSGGDPKGEIAARRALALAYAGRGQEAGDQCISIASRLEGPSSLEWKGRGAEQYLASGHVEQGLKLLREILPRVGLRLPSTPGAAAFEMVLRLLQLRLRGLGYRPRREAEIDPLELLRVDLSFAAAKGLIAVDSMRGALFCFVTLINALSVGELRRVGRGLALVGGAVLSSAGGFMSRWGQQMLEEAQRVADRTADPYLAGFGAVCTGQVRILDGNWREVVALSDRGGALLRAENLDYSWEATAGRMGLLRGLEELGHWTRALEEAEQLRREAERRGDRYAKVTAMLFAGAAYLAADEPAMARKLVADADRAWDHGGFHVQHFYGARLACLIDLYEGSVRDAAERLALLWPQLVKASLLRISVTRVDALLLRARVSRAAGDDRSAEAALARLKKEGRADLNAHAQLLRSVRGDAPSDPATAFDAGTRFAALGMEADAAVARLFAGHRSAGEELNALGVRAPDRWMAARLGLRSRPSAPGDAPDARSA